MATRAEDSNGEFLKRLREQIRDPDPRERWEAVRSIRTADLSDPELRREVLRLLLLRLLDPDPYVRETASNTALRIDVKGHPDLIRMMRAGLAWQRASEELARQRRERRPEELPDQVPEIEVLERHPTRRARRGSTRPIPKTGSSGEEPAAGSWSEYEERDLRRLKAPKIRILQAEEVTPLPDPDALDPRQAPAQAADPTALPTPLLSPRSFLRMLAAACSSFAGSTSGDRFTALLNKRPLDLFSHAVREACEAAGEPAFAILLTLTEATNSDLRRYASTLLVHWTRKPRAVERLVLALQRRDLRARRAVAETLRLGLAATSGQREICLRAIARAENGTTHPQRAKAVGLLLRAHQRNAWTGLPPTPPQPKRKILQAFTERERASRSRSR